MRDTQLTTGSVGVALNIVVAMVRYVRVKPKRSGLSRFVRCEG